MKAHRQAKLEYFFLLLRNQKAPVHESYVLHLVRSMKCTNEVLALEFLQLYAAAPKAKRALIKKNCFKYVYLCLIAIEVCMSGCVYVRYIVRDNSSKAKQSKDEESSTKQHTQLKKRH